MITSPPRTVAPRIASQGTRGGTRGHTGVPVASFPSPRPVSPPPPTTRHGSTGADSREFQPPCHTSFHTPFLETALCRLNFVP